jgi:hypothetical protein
MQFSITASHLLFFDRHNPSRDVFVRISKRLFVLWTHDPVLEERMIAPQSFF